MTEIDTIRAALVKLDELEALLDELSFAYPREVYRPVEKVRERLTKDLHAAEKRLLREYAGHGFR